MPKGKTPNQRTTEELRKQGILVGTVEKWNPAIRIRQDLWGMIDLVSVGPGGRFQGHQPTSDNGGNVAKHLDKLRRQPHYEKFLRDGGQLFVWGWAKKGPRGEQKKWTPRIIEMTLGEYPPLPPLPKDTPLNGSTLPQEEGLDACETGSQEPAA